MPGSERYTILEEIASGSTATVYLAEDTLLRRKVALKKLHPHLHNHADMVRRFAKEAVAIAALSHENIIRVFEYGNQERNLFLAMEYVDGMTLEALLKEAAPGESLPNLVALSVFRQLLEGLAAAHARGIYHRDIKPSNVLIDRKGCVRIADFGIAFLSDETSITRTGSFLGTPGYSAPEQAEGLDTTDKTDVFSMGILFYRCLTGRLPFEGDTPHAVLRAIMERAPAKATSRNPRVLPGLPEYVEAMLAKNPRERPTASECIARLEELTRQSGFRFEAQRLACFQEEGAAYSKKENQEITDRFLADARQSRSRGLTRDSLKSYAWAEVFSPDSGSVREEADHFLAKLRSAGRKRILAGALAGMALLTILSGWWYRHLSVKSAVLAHPNAPSVPAEDTGASPTIRSDETGMHESEQAKHAVLASQVAGTRPVAENPGPAKPPATHVKKREPIRLMVAKAGFPDSLPTQTLPSPSSAPEIAVPSALSNLPGYLNVKTSPPFAKLFVDGVEAGITPTKVPLEIKAGAHELILEREGCRPMHSTFTIVPKETTSLRVSLEKSGGGSR
jgi:serine/threonine-protein kinase